MENLTPQSLHQQAELALRRGREPKKVVFWYAGITLVLSLLMNLGNLYLEHQISGTGGLGNLGTRAIYSTVQQMLPLLSTLAAMCLDLGYLSAMMRISRGQYADQTDLKTGFRRFWPLMRMSLLQGLVYFAAGLAAFQLSYLVFMLTPWSEPLTQYLSSLMASGSVQLDDTVIVTAASMMVPLLILFAVAYLALLIPFLFWFRMAYFCLLDNPQAGALHALGTSRKLMRHRFLPMLKIDLSLWPYYAVTVLVSLILYGDLLLPLVGLELPFSAQTVSFIFFGLALAVQFALHVFLRNKAETVYLLVYDQLREKPKSDGVVLGNIFDM